MLNGCDQSAGHLPMDSGCVMEQNIEYERQLHVKKFVRLKNFNRTNLSSIT